MFALLEQPGGYVHAYFEEGPGSDFIVVLPTAAQQPVPSMAPGGVDPLL